MDFTKEQLSGVLCKVVAGVYKMSGGRNEASVNLVGDLQFSLRIRSSTESNTTGLQGVFAADK